MTGSRCRSALLVATSVALTSSVSTLALAQDAARTIANNGSILVDGRTFTVTPGTAKGDVSAQVKDLGAREMGPGAIIFRSGDKLYIVDAVPLTSVGKLDRKRLRTGPAVAGAVWLRRPVAGAGAN